MTESTDHIPTEKGFPTTLDDLSTTHFGGNNITRACRFPPALPAGILLLVLSAIGSAQTVTAVYSFTGKNSSANPSEVMPTQGRDGKLYGTSGGNTGGVYGTVFSLATNGLYRQLHTFDSTNGANPDGGVALASDGNFYGTATGGGSGKGGVLFKITPNGVYTVLHSFLGGSDGTLPAAPPIEGSDGSLYGTTYGNTTTYSTIYKYSRASGTYSTLYQFDQPHGQFVIAPLIQATDGNLYGTAFQGGGTNCGTIFEVNTSGLPLFTYSFPCGLGGSSPVGPLLQTSDGSFYGTTSLGGSAFVGTIFKLDQKGNVQTLYSFQGFSGRNADGSSPYGGLYQATDGKLYGSASAGGTQNFGTLFQITTSGSYKQLYSFTAPTGSFASGALMQDTNGLLYGTTLLSGRFGFGTVYSLDLGLLPFVALVRYTGKIGSKAQILGQGLTGTTSVTFNGVNATTFTVFSDTYMTATVPTGATTGPVVVTTPSRTLTSNVNFRVQ